MSERTVRTFEELKQAKNDHVTKIIVEGKLAKDLLDARKIATLSVSSITALTAAISAAIVGLAATPITGGISTVLSAAVAGPIAISTGLSVPTIIFLATLGTGGIIIIVALLKEYTIEVDANKNDPNFKVILHRK